jgi:ADP-ribose pyrophosphatase YjhB (NUDIX family)
MDYPRLPKDEFMAIYHRVPRAAVDVIVKTDQGIVLTKRSIPPYQGMWHIPGGTILFMEPVDHALARIAAEELGIEIKVVGLLGLIEYFNDNGRHTICNEYLAQIASGEIRGSDQGEEWAFFNQVPDNIIPEQGDFLNKHIRELFFDL